MPKPSCEILDDGTKATLFGKFYEDIVSRWLEKVRGYRRIPAPHRKPRVVWESVSLPDFESPLCQDFRQSLDQKRRQGKWCTPDGLFETPKVTFLLWEAKNWTYDEQPQTPRGKFDRLRKAIVSLPQVLAERAECGHDPYALSGFLFSWWHDPYPNASADLRRELEELTGRSFEFLWTSEILDACRQNQFRWYLDILGHEEERALRLFADLRSPL